MECCYSTKILATANIGSNIPSARRRGQRFHFLQCRGSSPGADPGFFLGGGALVSCSTSTPTNHIVFFFGRIPVVLENPHVISEGGGGAHPAPSP